MHERREGGAESGGERASGGGGGPGRAGPCWSCREEASEEPGKRERRGPERGGGSRRALDGALRGAAGRLLRGPVGRSAAAAGGERGEHGAVAVAPLLVFRCALRRGGGGEEASERRSEAGLGPLLIRGGVAGWGDRGILSPGEQLSALAERKALAFHLGKLWKVSTHTKVGVFPSRKLGEVGGLVGGRYYWIHGSVCFSSSFPSCFVFLKVCVPPS